MDRKISTVTFRQGGKRSMSLREQFEAWVLKHKPAMWGFENETAWDAYQAGHAASGRDELDEALRKIEREFHDSPAHGALACRMVKIATEAINKARGEA
jgi:hypothetical protein